MRRDNSLPDTKYVACNGLLKSAIYTITGTECISFKLPQRAVTTLTGSSQRLHTSCCNRYLHFSICGFAFVFTFSFLYDIGAKTHIKIKLSYLMDVLSYNGMFINTSPLKQNEVNIDEWIIFRPRRKTFLASLTAFRTYRATRLVRTHRK